MVRKILVLGLLVALNAGCSGAPEASAGASADAVTANQAAKDLDFTETVLADEPATKEGQSGLGIVSWSVFSASRGEHGTATWSAQGGADHFYGTAAFATDASGNVKYAVLVDLPSAQAVLLRYDADGVDRPGTARITKEEAAQIDREVANLRAKVQARLDSTGTKTQSVLAASECGLRVAVIGLAGATAFFTAVVGANVAVTALGGIAATGVTTDLVASFGLGSLGFGTSVSLALAATISDEVSDYLHKTGAACSKVLR
jgi:hypothetical protein